MDKILDVLYGPMSSDGKWYHCPHCKTAFNFMEVLNQEVAERVNDDYRVYKCKECNGLFRMPE